MTALLKVADRWHEMKKATSSEEQRSQAHGDSTTGKRKTATSKASKSNVEKSHITLTQYKGEPRVDSRVLAEQLGNNHKSSVALIDRYLAKFRDFGVLAFEMSKPTPGSGGGRPERFALLNEDQAFFLLALSRNTDRVVNLKSDLVMAFREARYGYACQTLEAERRKASKSGRLLADWRYKKPRLHGRVAYLKAQMLLPFELEDATNDSHQ